MLTTQWSGPGPQGSLPALLQLWGPATQWRTRMFLNVLEVSQGSLCSKSISTEGLVPGSQATGHRGPGVWPALEFTLS